MPFAQFQRRRPTSMRKDAIQTRKRKSKKRRDYSLALAAVAAASANSATALAAALQHQQQRNQTNTSPSSFSGGPLVAPSIYGTGHLLGNRTLGSSLFAFGSPFGNKSVTGSASIYPSALRDEEKDGKLSVNESARYNPPDCIIPGASREHCGFNEQLSHSIWSPGRMNTTRSMLDYHCQVRLSYQLQQRGSLPPINIHSSLVDPFLCSATALRYQPRSDPVGPGEIRSNPNDRIIPPCETHSTFWDAYPSAESYLLEPQRSQIGFGTQMVMSSLPYSTNMHNNQLNPTNLIVQPATETESSGPVTMGSDVSYQNYSKNAVQSAIEYQP
ncbi:hypothetical protein D915_000420 [Fasciola hepatica]|uniref:Uncharacterized protein n=1 Tax=Fasciola hepatica TaxID=6192 RepID=A0A4E0RME3_FASHE|nr:hypothetical protein D915_000420 [Fasciola hepatica]